MKDTIRYYRMRNLYMVYFKAKSKTEEIRLTGLIIGILLILLILIGINYV
jgi:hypothetical protein